MSMERLAPLVVAPDTWLVRHIARAPGTPTLTFINTLVIRGAEPTIVDTGAAVARASWLEDTFSLVDPADVRWIFLSHDDVDHDGNLDPLLDLCPRATLVTTWLALQRMTSARTVPLDRCRWVNDGDSFSAGDRRFLAVCPPVYDSPATRGLYDSATGLYWAADAFGTRVLAPVDEVRDLDPTEWAEGAVQFAQFLSPWHNLVDRERFAHATGQLRDLAPTAIATAHGPLIRGGQVDAAIALLRSLPSRRPVIHPGQTELAAAVAATTVSAQSG